MEVVNDALIDYDPAIHDKMFMLQNAEVTERWAKDCKSFQESELAQDYEVLALSDGWVASNLAIYSPYWAHTPAAQDFRVLVLNDGWVACDLASYAKHWGMTPAAQQLDVLKLREGRVVYLLAQDSPYWFPTEAAHSKTILSICPDYLPAFYLGAKRFGMANSVFTTDSNSAFSSEEVALNIVLHRFISAGAFRGLSKEAISTDYADEFDHLTLIFKNSTLDDLIQRLDESLMILKVEDQEMPRNVLLARCTISLRLMTELFPKCAEVLQAKSDLYFKSLFHTIASMSDEQLDLLFAYCEATASESELVIFNRVKFDLHLANDTFLVGEPSDYGEPSAPALY